MHNGMAHDALRNIFAWVVGSRIAKALGSAHPHGPATAELSMRKEDRVRFLHGNCRKPICGVFFACFLILSAPSVLGAQAEDGSGVDLGTVQLLMKRIDQLEARVKELESANKQPEIGAPVCNLGPSNVPFGKTVAPSEAPPVSVPAVPTNTGAILVPTAPSFRELDQTPTESFTSERLDLSKTLLRIRGFGDASLHGDTQKGDSTYFSLGQLDLFVTSEMSDKFRFLADILFEGGPDKTYSVNSAPSTILNVDVERYLLQYSKNDYLNISTGRGHVAIGYYSAAYQHSTWLQTTVGRPFLYEFEDEGGILPIHMIGVSASGMIPSGSLGLHYVAEVGNGRASRIPIEQEAIPNSIDDENHFAFNLAGFVRPDAIQGFQTGFSVYHDVLSPANAHKISETIMAAHAILIRPKYEWLNEAVLDRQAIVGTPRAFNTPGFYSQVSRQYGLYRPYFRYQYLNVANSQPVFPDVALRHGPSLGVRFDASESVALKFQYDYTFLRAQPGIHGLTTQVDFTF